MYSLWSRLSLVIIIDLMIFWSNSRILLSFQTQPPSLYNPPIPAKSYLWSNLYKVEQIHIHILLIQSEKVFLNEDCNFANCILITGKGKERQRNYLAWMVSYNNFKKIVWESQTWNFIWIHMKWIDIYDNDQDQDRGQKKSCREKLSKQSM